MSTCLRTHHPLLVILCHLQDKERKGTKQLVDDRKTRIRRGWGKKQMAVQKQKKKILTCLLPQPVSQSGNICHSYIEEGRQKYRWVKEKEWQRRIRRNTNPVNIQCHNVVSTSWCCSDVVTALWRRCVFAANMSHSLLPSYHLRVRDGLKIFRLITEY